MMNSIDRIKKIYRKIMDLLPDGLMIIDKNGIVLYMNNVSESFNGKSKEDLIGKNVRDLVNDKFFTPAASLKALNSGKTEIIMQELRNKKKLMVYAYPLKIENEIEYIVTISKDITEQLILKQMLEEKEQLIQFFTESYEMDSFDGMKLHSYKMDKINRLIQKIAFTDINVLLTGESGVGKTHYAKIIHNLSKRKEKPFVVINCGAIPENLLESELFGYVAGSFTGASSKGSPGLFESANGGTIFLDEIGEIPLHLQVKLLEVIQEKKTRRIGSKEFTPIDFRLITATNQDLRQLIKEKRFREDLYYRINSFEIEMPPLREHIEDIPMLVQHFVQKYNQRENVNKQVNGQFIGFLCRYDWPGNIRELEHIIESACIISEGEFLSVEELPEDIVRLHEIDDLSVMLSKEKSLKTMLELVEKEIIQKEYEKYKNSYKVAEALKISQPSAWRKIKKYCSVLYDER